MNALQGEIEAAVKKYGDQDVEWSLQGMLRLAPATMRRLFAPVLVSIRQAIGDVLNHPNTRGWYMYFKKLIYVLKVFEHTESLNSPLVHVSFEN